MKANVSYSLILNKVQADYLAASKYGINRMQALVSLIDLTQTEEETYEKRGFTATSLPPSRSASSSLPRWNCPACGGATARPFPGSSTR